MILLVDDEPEMLRLLSLILMQHGYATVMVESADAALKTLANNRIDLMIVDISMPTIDGFETIKLVRADGRWDTLPTIVYSARMSSADKTAATEAGASAYLIKPTPARDLVNQVKLLLDSQA